MVIPKTKTLIFLVVGLVVLFALLVFFSSQSYLPYDNNKTNYVAYEPMTELITGSEPAPSASLPSSTSVSNNVAVSSNFAPLNDTPKTIKYGEVNMSELIDKIGQTPKNGVDGVDGCVSSGISNAGGPICLSPEMIQLLKSRGGNATGGSV